MSPKGKRRLWDITCYENHQKLECLMNLKIQLVYAFYLRLTFACCLLENSGSLCLLGTHGSSEQDSSLVTWPTTLAWAQEEERGNTGGHEKRSIAERKAAHLAFDNIFMLFKNKWVIYHYVVLIFLSKSFTQLS